MQIIYLNYIIWMDGRLVLVLVFVSSQELTSLCWRSWDEYGCVLYL